jgi:hypothetical protein
MSQIKKKFIGDNSIDESKILLLNNGALRARNAADSGDVELLKLTSSDKLEFLTLPQVTSDPVALNDIIRKSYLDAQVQSANAYTDQKIADLVDSAPALLDTLNELAAALGDDPNFVTTVTTAISNEQTAREQADIALDGRLDIIEGDATVEGSVAKAEADAKAYADGLIAQEVIDRDAAIAVETAAREAEDLTFLKLDGSRPMTGALNMNGNSVSGADGVSANTVTVGSEHYIGLGEANLGPIDNVTGDYTWLQVTTTKVELEQGDNVSNTLFKMENKAFSFSGGDIAVGSQKITNLADGTVSSDAVNKGQLDASASATLASAEAYTDQEVLTEKNRAEAAEAALDLRVDALEAASVEFVQEKFTLASGDISNGYVTLANLAIGASINAYVDRLAIHETDDYTISVVGGVTRITFAGSLITVGQEKLSVGDIVRVKYAKVAIV